MNQKIIKHKIDRLIEDNKVGIIEGKAHVNYYEFILIEVNSKIESTKLIDHTIPYMMNFTAILIATISLMSWAGEAYKVIMVGIIAVALFFFLFLIIFEMVMYRKSKQSTKELILLQGYLKVYLNK